MPLRLIQAFPVRGHDLPDGFQDKPLCFLVRQRHIQPVLVNVIVNGKQPRLLHGGLDFLVGHLLRRVFEREERQRTDPRDSQLFAVIAVHLLEHCPVDPRADANELLPAVGQTRVCFAVKQMLLPVAHRERLAIGDLRPSPLLPLFDAAPLFDLRCAEPSRH